MGSDSGVLLREWRTRRRLSQLDLAVRADVSMKHVSNVETGRARPSPEMIVHLCASLDVPLRDRNSILLAAGFAPRYSEGRLDDAIDGELREALDIVLAGHTYPAVIVNATWDLVASNDAAAVFLDGVTAELLVAPINVIRLSLHPDGLASRVANFDAYAAHVLARVQRANRDRPLPALQALLDEFGHLARRDEARPRGILLPLELATPEGTLRMFSTIATFGSPHDVVLSELAIESFYPADPASARLLRARTATPG